MKPKRVILNNAREAWASCDTTGTPIFAAGVKLADGRRVQFFLNLDSGLIVVDVIDKGCRGGNEILRRCVDTVPTAASFRDVED